MLDTRSRRPKQQIRCVAYKRDEKPEFEVRQLSDANQIIGRFDRTQFEAWLEDRQLIPGTPRNLTAIDDILAELDRFCSARFTILVGENP
jgi:hypothetical protein